MNDSIHSNCNYRFKGNSCNECPLNCIHKNRNNSRRSGRMIDTEAILHDFIILIMVVGFICLLPLIMAIGCVVYPILLIKWIVER